MRPAEGQNQRKRERNSRNAGWKDGKKKRANLIILCYNKM